MGTAGSRSIVILIRSPEAVTAGLEQALAAAGFMPVPLGAAPAAWPSDVALAVAAPPLPSGAMPPTWTTAVANARARGLTVALANGTDAAAGAWLDAGLADLVLPPADQASFAAAVRAAARQRSAPAAAVPADSCNGDCDEYRLIFERSTDPMFTLERSTDGRMVYRSYNARAEEISGLRASQVVGKTPDEAFPPAMAAWFNARYRACAESGTTMAYEETLQLPEGERHFNTALVPVQGPDGVTGRIIGIARDITALRSAELRARSILESVSVFVALLDPHGRVIEVNRSALDSVDAHLTDVVGTPFWDGPWWRGSETSALMVRDAVKAAAQGRRSRFDIEITPPGKPREIIDCAVNPVFDESGAVVMIVPEGHIVTDKRLAEAAIRDSEMRFRALAANSPDAIFVIDTDGHQVEFFNRDSYLGWSRAELEARDGIVERIHPADVDALHQAWQEHTTDGATPAPVECRLRARNGRWVWLESRQAVLESRPDGRPGRLLVTLTDIDARTRQIRRSAEQNAALLAVNSGRSFDELTGLVRQAIERECEGCFCGIVVFGAAPEPAAGGSRPLLTQTILSADGTPLGALRLFGPSGVRLPDSAPGMLEEFAVVLALALERQRAADDLTRHRNHLENLIANRTRALSESESRFHRAVENAPLPIMIHDAGGRVDSINRSWTALTGHTISDVSRLQPIARRAANGEFPVETSLGSQLIWDFSVAELGRLEDGRVAYITMAVDVTERKRADERLRRLTRAVDQSPATVVITDRTGRIEYVNPAFTRITGYTEAEALGQNPRILKSGQHTPEFFRDFWHTITSGREWHGEFCNRKKDGSLYWESAVVAPTRDENGDITSYIAVKTDISDSKRREAELRELALVAHEIDSMVVVTDSARRIVWSNPAFTRITGFRADEVAGLKPGEVLQGPGTDPATVARIHDALGRRETVRVEILNYAKNGRPYWIDLNIQPVYTTSGEIERFISISSDITERRFTALQLERARQEADQANKAKSAFLANISHEIRTPLNAVIGYCNLVMKTRLDDEQRDWVGKIHTSGALLLGLINDVLDFSRIESGKMGIERRDFDLRHSLESVRAVFGQRIAEKGLEFRIEAATGLPERVHGDSLHLEQILNNLIGNAVKFTERGSIILGIAPDGEEAERLRLRFTVADTGIGMPAAVLDRLFQPFTQADNSTVRRFGGTGLGLSISKRLAEMMDGDISVDSAEGRGSIFTVRLWFGRAAEPDAPTAAPLELDDPLAALRARAAGCRILVVEDSPLNQELVLVYLEEAGITADVADTGTAAVEKVRSADPPYDLVLMDIQMPELDGYDATRSLRAEPRFASLPIIAMTAHAFQEERDKAQAAGMDDHIAKPIDINELYRVMLRHLPAQPEAV